MPGGATTKPCQILSTKCELIYIQTDSLDHCLGLREGHIQKYGDLKINLLSIYATFLNDFHPVGVIFMTILLTFREYIQNLKGKFVQNERV